MDTDYYVMHMLCNCVTKLSGDRFKIRFSEDVARENVIFVTRDIHSFIKMCKFISISQLTTT